MSLPRIATREEWLAARKELLAKEKNLTRQHDALSTERRNLPMVEIAKDYQFDGPDGRVRLIDLFENRPQLMIYHFMFHPEWEEGCSSCSAGTDELSPGFLEHLHVRDTTYAMVSRAPLDKLQVWKARKGWELPWYSSSGSDFNYDFGVTIDASRGFGEYNYRSLDEYAAAGQESMKTADQPYDMPGLSCFLQADAACSTRTPSTPGDWSPPGAPITSSTSPLSDGKRSGRSLRAAPSLPGRLPPTSHRDLIPAVDGPMPGPG